MKNSLFEEIVNSQFLEIIFQPTKNIISPSNMFVINFAKNRRIYSLHIFCFLRIMKNQKILLTSSDEFVNLNYKISEFYNNTEESLLTHNISNVNKILYNSRINFVDFYECGDLIIEFNENITIEVRPDCLVDQFEYYRLFEYGKENKKTVVSYIDNDIKVHHI